MTIKSARANKLDLRKIPADPAGLSERSVSFSVSDVSMDTSSPEKTDISSLKSPAGNSEVLSKSSKVLQRTEFGNPILRAKARPLSTQEIAAPKTQRLIKDMRATLATLKIGIGLAAPQVGQGIRLAVIDIQPTKHRPEVKPFSLVIINPEITQTIGRKKQLWEGCISAGSSTAGMFAKVPRYEKIKVKFRDEQGTKRHQLFEGLAAHVIQHEVDHLHGILFVDRVKDTKSYMTYSEYMKQIVKK